MMGALCPACRTTWSPTCPLCNLQTLNRRQQDESMRRAMTWLEGALPRSGQQVLLPTDEMGIIQLVARAIEHGEQCALPPPDAKPAALTPEQERQARFQALELEDSPVVDNVETGLRPLTAVLGLGRLQALKLELDEVAFPWEEPRASS